MQKVLKQVLLITSNFPYGTKEQFLENEVKYYQNVDLTIMPIKTAKYRREVPKNIKIDKFLAKEFSKKSKYISLLKSFTKKVFFKEIVTQKIVLKEFFYSLYHYQMFYEIFEQFFKNQKDPQNFVIYTFWHNEATYALETLKEKYNYKLITRIHGIDLYKERRISNYMPLKSQFVKKIDKIFTLTPKANIYLQNSYNISKDKLKVSRLGVEDRGIVSKQSEKSSLYILSCSYLTEVKRVDKIIYAIKKLSTIKSGIKINWTHIGGGYLLEDLQSLAKKELGDKTNIEYSFLGSKSNYEVYEFYKNSRVDLFINSSISEGVPVSIMEAMSCKIPIVAPDIGGISDMVVDGYSGILLSSKVTVDEIVTALRKIDFFKDEKTRENSYKLFLEKYNAKNNYTNFVNQIISL